MSMIFFRESHRGARGVKGPIGEEVVMTSAIEGTPHGDIEVAGGPTLHDLVL